MDLEGGGTEDLALEKSRNIGFLSNTGLDPLKITKLPNQSSMLGHQRNYLNCVSLAGR